MELALANDRPQGDSQACLVILASSPGTNVRGDHPEGTFGREDMVDDHQGRKDGVREQGRKVEGERRGSVTPDD